MYDLIIKYGTIIDGTGNPRYASDIAIRGEEISKIQEHLTVPPGVTVIDASGLIVSPGFIDMQDHSDYSLLVDRDAPSAQHQGVTTVVFGNCGLSCYPVVAEYRVLLESYLVGLGYNHSHSLDWEDFDGYARELEKDGLGVNVVPLVGHGSIRIAVMGFDARQPTKEEQGEMRRLLMDALKQGAFGMSSGLVYPPGINSTTQELQDLCAIVAKKGGIYSSHLRGDTLRAGPTLVESLQEALDVARATGVDLQVSHIAPKFPNTGVSQRVIDMMQKARDEGFNVACDVHPYMAAMTFLASLLPPWVFEGGTKETTRRLTDKGERARILKDMRSQFSHLDWDEFWFRNEPVPADPNSKFKGKRLTEIGNMMGKDPQEAFLDVLADEGEDLFKVVVLEWIYSEDDTLATFLWPYTMIGADGVNSSKESRIESISLHPRSWGTFPKVISKYYKEGKQIELESVINKMTGLASTTLGLADRGFIKEGMKADVVVFDLDRFTDKATYTEPRQYAEGVEYLLVNGGLAIERGRSTGNRSAKVLRRR
ncbi:MAG TPA: D-aminoacylase [Desulfatiglandales bacterium]|nr:D-aminoacylase [Desulfatiglandales bacterium]